MSENTEVQAQQPQQNETLTLKECADVLFRAFNALGELEVKGKFADTVAGLRQSIAAVNNSLLVHDQNAGTKKQKKEAAK